VHSAYLEAGADCIATVTYQATFQGFAARGMNDREAVAAFELAVDLAVAARDRFWSDPRHREGRIRPLVAASIGPYGAFLADGSEYRGDYGLPVGDLVDFHRRRWDLLAATQVDLLACETIPSAVEAQALLALLDGTPHRWAWISFQCRDDGRLADGTPLAEVADRCWEHPRVAAVGVNCVPPGSVAHLLSARGRGPAEGSEVFMVYPNSGELYDPVTKTWRQDRDLPDPAALALGWLGQGASVLGGCCRTTPDTIGAMRRALISRV